MPTRSQFSLRLFCLVLLLSPSTSARCAPKDAGHSGLHFRTPEEVVLSLSEIDRLYGSHPFTNQGREETFQYRVRAKVLFLRLGMGSMSTTITGEPYEGRDCYHICQKIAVLGHHQKEDTYLDATGLFPYEYRLETRRPLQSIRTHVVQWDVVEGTLFLRKNKQGTIRDEVRILGQDDPRDSRDPLSAMLLYRHLCSAATNVVDWSCNILMSSDERYTLQAIPTNQTRTATTDIKELRWEWKARDCEEEDKTVFGWIRVSSSNAIPQRYSTRVWGTSGSATLTSYTAKQPALTNGMARRRE
jgi:hypothetical protein